MKTLRPLLPFLLASLAISCQSAPEPGDANTTSLVTAEGYVGTRNPTVFLLVADDADTPDAAQLRGRLTESLRQGLQHEIDERWGSCGSKDPAQWHPGDIRVVVARPSAPDSEALLTSVDIAKLAWITQTSLVGEIDAVVAAATEALGKRLATSNDVYRPLHTAAHAVDLLTGARMPATSAESEFMTTLPKSFVLEVIVANTRPDADPQSISQVLPTPTMNDKIYISGYAVFGPSNMGGPTCEVSPVGNSRLESWTTQTMGHFYAWPCAEQTTWDLLMVNGWADCGPVCHTHAIQTHTDGSAECKIFIEQPDLTKCDAAQGWQDPDGKASLVDRNGVQLRRCEMIQHTGANLDACRHSLECTNCGSGFCVTEVPELVPDDGTCNGSDVPWALRFTGGATAADGAWISTSCLESTK